MWSAVRIFDRAAIGVTAVGLLWAGLAYTVSRPVDADGYLRTALQVAASAHDAAATGGLTARQQLDGKVFAAFTVAAYDDATKALAGAAKKLADQAPPDDASTRLRDRLAPLVQTTERDLGDAAEADDDDALRAAITGLDDVAGRLNDLIEQHQ
jgi:hypothetical protein